MPALDDALSAGGRFERKAPAGAAASPGDNELSIQRMRAISGLLETCHRHGIHGATVTRVARAAGLSRADFYEAFDSWESCVGETFDVAATRAIMVTVPASREASLVRSVRAGLLALLTFLDREPEMAWFLIVESLAADMVTRLRRQRMLNQIAESVAQYARSKHVQLDEFTAESMLTVVLMSIHARLLQRSDPSAPTELVELLGPLMETLTLRMSAIPAEHQPLEEPPAGRPESAARPEIEPNGVSRLTYRTARVLLAVAENPGANNRSVSDAAGIADQGQMSKLLRRLCTLGLLVNLAAQGPSHRPNCWFLTEKGRALATSIRSGSWANDSVARQPAVRAEMR